MSQYYLNIIGKVGLSDYSKIHDYMAIVGEDDDFVITYNNGYIDDSKIISTMLQNNNFCIQGKGEENNGKKYISATRNKR